MITTLVAVFFYQIAYGMSKVYWYGFEGGRG